MAELDPVRQEITAQADEFLATFDEMIAKAEEFSSAMDGVLNKIAELDLSASAASAGVDALAGRLNDARNAAVGAGTAAGTAAGRMNDLRNAAAGAAVAESAAGDAAVGLAAKTAAAGAAVSVTTGFWARWGTVIHWVVSAGAELLAVVLPAAIAAAAGAFVLYQGVVEQVGFRMQALYTATESTAAMIGKTTGDVLGLGHAFQTAQNQANPIAYQLLGEYINTARSHMVDLASAGLQVARALGELGARIQVDLLRNSAEFQGLLANMVPDLIQLGQVFGNLGHAILNFAADMPGLAEVLLRIADALSRVILWVSELPRWLILSFMAFEELNRWGGLVVGMFGRLGLASATLAGGILSPVRAIGILRALLGVIPAMVEKVGAVMAAAGAEMGFFGADVYAAGVAVEAFGAESSAAVAGLSAGWVLAIAAAAVVLGILIDKAITAKSTIQAFGDSLEKNVAKATNLQAFGLLADSMGQMNTEASKVSASVNDSARALERENQAAGQAASATTQFNAVQRQLMTSTSNLVGGADLISQTYGTTFTESLALADAAGVKLVKGITGQSEAAQIARAQIAGLVQGYKAMDQTGGILGADMNVLAIQTGLASTKVSQLNSAWDQFVSNGTSLTSTLATLNQDITQIGNTGVAVGRKFSTFSGTTVLAINKAAESLTSFSGTGAQTWQNYDAALQQAQQFTDALRTAAAYGAVTQRQYTGSIADTVQSLLPFAAHSKTAVEELSALAQEAGGPATSSYKRLKEWADQNNISAKQFNKAIQDVTGSLTTAGAAASEFASTLQSQMQSKLASALLSTNNINGAVGQFQQAVLKAGGQISSSSPQYKALERFLEAAGYSAKQARAEMRLLQRSIDSIHGTHVNIDVNTLYTQSGNRPPNQSLPGGSPGGVGGASGGFVHGPGTKTSDSVAARLSRGEFVMQASAVDHYGRSVMEAMNAKRYAAGGPAGSPGPSSSALQATVNVGGGELSLSLEVTNKLDGHTISTQQRREILKYDRRNRGANWKLRVR